MVPGVSSVAREPNVSCARPVVALKEDVISLLQTLPPQAWQRAGLAFVLTALLIQITQGLAWKLGLVDLPGGRKQHEAPTPVTGGLAILIALLGCALVFGDFRSTAMRAFFLSGSLLALFGLLDDFRGLRSRTLFMAQIAAVLIVALVGGVTVHHLSDVFGIDGAYLGWLTLPVTVFVFIGVINALNMADGSDGVAAGQALVSLGLLSCYALYAGNISASARLLMICGALAGFLVWNLRSPWRPRARVFLGNAGSMLVGFIIAWSAVRLTQNPAHPVSPVLGPWTISLPLIDCVTVTIRRLHEGRSPFSAGRDHLHHLLLEAGYSPAYIAIGLMWLSAVLGLVSGFALIMDTPRPMLVVAFLSLLAAYYWLTSDRGRAVRFFRRLTPARLDALAHIDDNTMETMTRRELP